MSWSDVKVVPRVLEDGRERCLPSLPPVFAKESEVLRLVDSPEDESVPLLSPCGFVTLSADEGYERLTGSNICMWRSERAGDDGERSTRRSAGQAS